MSCVTSEMANNALLKMRKFYLDLSNLYRDYGIEIFDDVCRRNALMSHAQERFFAEELEKKYPTAISDGRTGMADIVIPEINKEVECKLTTKRSKGGFSLQTDYNTLSKKGSLDFLYVLTDRGFSKFSVLFFKGLTVDDFHPPSPGSKGKAKMNKSSGMKKCEVLVGEISVQNKIEIQKINGRIKDAKDNFSKSQKDLSEKLVATKRASTRARIEKRIKREANRFEEKVSKLHGKKKYWSESTNRFLIELSEAHA
jgi:hypothetical protein